MNPTALLYGLMVLKGAQNAQYDEIKRMNEWRAQMQRDQEERTQFWCDFDDQMDRTFKRGQYRE